MPWRFLPASAPKRMVLRAEMPRFDLQNRQEKRHHGALPPQDMSDHTYNSAFGLTRRTISTQRRALLASTCPVVRPKLGS